MQKYITIESKLHIIKIIYLQIKCYKSLNLVKSTVKIYFYK